ncbi:MAG: Uma2 family endonuclease [Vulcanimicrobiaceae bacterium]
MKEPVVPRLTGGEYLGWEQRQEAKFELHHGFVLAFAGGTVAHDQIAFNLRVALARAYPPPCRTFGSDLKVRASADAYFYADAGVLCEPIGDDQSVVERPRVVAEVLSPSTRAYDLVEKRAAYKDVASLAAIAFVESHLRRVEVETLRSDGTWHSAYYDDGEAWIGDCRVALDEIYAGTSLAAQESR